MSEGILFSLLYSLDRLHVEAAAFSTDCCYWKQFESDSQPAEKQDKAKKEAAKEKPKAKAAAAAAQDNKKTDKNAAKNKEEEAALEKDADELHKAIEGKRV